MIAMLLYLALMAHMGDTKAFPVGTITGATVAGFDPVVGTSVDGSELRYYPTRFPVAAPPRDVPAISIKIEPWQCFQKYDGCRVMDGEGKYLSADEWLHYKGNTETLTYYRDGCADKSRVLLTAEDGTRHCIKF